MYCLSSQIRFARLIELSAFEETDSALVSSQILDIMDLVEATLNNPKRR